MKYLIASLLLSSSVAIASEQVAVENDSCERDEEGRVLLTEKNQDDEVCAAILAAAGTKVAVISMGKGLSAKAVVASGVTLGALAALKNENDDDLSVIQPPPPVEPPTPPTTPPSTTPSTSDTGTSGTSGTGSTAGTSSTGG